MICIALSWNLSSDSPSKFGKTLCDGNREQDLFCNTGRTFFQSYMLNCTFHKLAGWRSKKSVYFKRSRHYQVEEGCAKQSKQTSPKINTLIHPVAKVFKANDILDLPPSISLCTCMQREHFVFYLQNICHWVKIYKMRSKE